MKKETTVTLRLTHRQKKTLFKQAHENYKTMSEYVRDIAINSIKN